MTTLEPLLRAEDMTDEDYRYFASLLITGRFPEARPEQQRPEGDWSTWLLMAGRGFGKTRVGAEEVADWAITTPGQYFVCAPTYRDMELICLEGEKSGLLTVLRRRCVDFQHQLTKSTITLANGSKIICMGADEPSRWRGYNFNGGWADELAHWRRPDTWAQLKLSTRIGDRPRIVATTTPTRGHPLLVELIGDDDTVVTRGSTWDNAANLSPRFLEGMRKRYDGTRMGRQELEGELLLDNPGALWNLSTIEAGRVNQAPDLDRIVIGVDPAVTSGEDSDLTGIVVVGKTRNDIYILEDASGKYTPDGTARVASDLYGKFEADAVIGEVNNGGDYIGTVVRTVDRSIVYRSVSATRGKHVRAELASSLYEQGRAHHVGAFPELEMQLCDWTPDSPMSPDRMDALVWAVEDLMGDKKKGHARMTVRR